MKENQPQKRNTVSTVLVVLLLMVTTIAACIGMYAWAKYITQQNGNVAQNIAKWNFSMSLRAGEQTVTTPTQTLDLATTMYNEVRAGRIAPGTSGAFDIVINTTGTEVSLKYDVTINITDCPRNIIFTKQGPGDSSVVPLSAGGEDTYTRQLTFSKFLAYPNSSGTFTETVYWTWPYEGTVNGNATTYDLWDTADNNKDAKLSIIVTGTEMLSEPSNGGQSGQQAAPDSVQALAQAGTIKRWDTISYNPGNGTTASIDLPKGASIENPKVAALNLPDGASIDNGEIRASDSGNWVVLDVNQTTGEVLIMPKTVSENTLTLTGKDGYNNAKQALDAVAGIYVNSNYADSARSLTKEDCDRIDNHTPDGYTDGPYNWNHRYGMNSSTLDITDTGSDSNTPNQTYESTATTGGEDYYTSPSFAGITGWLASRCVSVSSDDCYFDVYSLSSGYVYDLYLFGVISDGSSSTGVDGLPVVPVVSLKSNIQLESSSTFYTETATGATVVAQSPTAFEHNAWSFK